VHRAFGAVASAADHRLDIYVTALMSIAALATSWAGYQASLWNGDQAVHGGNAASLRTNSTRISTHGGQLRIIDVQLFTSWLDAYAMGDTRRASFYEQRFRPEFRPAFRAWINSRPLRSPDAAPTPFNLAEYRVADDSEALRLARHADAESAASQRANRVSDGYVLDAVILASVSFFASSAQRGTSRRLRLVLFTLALAMCAMGVYRLLTSPLG
jgi:hypothetical protein